MDQASSDRQLGKVLPMPPAPDGIELRHLRAFVAVAEELNFGRAASRLYVSQPALSRQIRSLERLLGCDLLRRSTHQVELTLAGEALLDRANRLIAEVDDAIAATRSVGGEIQARIQKFWEPLYGLSAADAGLQALRTGSEELHSQFPVPPEATIRAVNAGGVHSLTVTTQPDQPVTMLHLHGGGYVMGSAFGYRHVAGAIALASETGVLLPEYRLAPEHPFPAALEDVTSAYTWLLDQGTPPEQLVVSGDSAGAALAISLLLTLREEGIALPGAAVLLCPGAIDLTLADLDDLPEEPQPALNIEQLRSFLDAYLGGHPDDDPLVNPAVADLTGLPRMLIQGGTDDVFLGDTHRIAELARKYGVDVRLELYPVATHDFHVFWSFLPEAADALREVGAFVREVQSAASDAPAARRPAPEAGA